MQSKNEEKESHCSSLREKNEIEIANEIGTHRNTIVRDVAFLKKSAGTWLDGLAKDGFIYEYKLGLDKIQDHERELNNLFLGTNQVSEKLQILKALDDNQKLYLELLGETPTVHAFRKIIQRENVQTA